MRLDLRRGLKDLHKGLDDFQRKQVPFGSALGLTMLAKGVQADELVGLNKTFDKPTPFTQRAFATIPATKGRLVATVFVKDIQAAYLEPYINGGQHYLGSKKGLLVPKNVGLNQYGNLTRNKLQALKSKPGVFIGPVTLKSGETINGVWQRPVVGKQRGDNGKRRTGGRGSKGNTQGKISGVRTGLKLLIRFEDPLPVKQRLDFYGRAQSYIQANAEDALRAGFAKAMSTAR